MKKVQLLLFIVFPSFAQTTLQVASKRFDKIFSDVKSVKIEAERADIELSTWEKNEIRVVIELIAKHPDRTTASQDLGRMKQVAEKVGKDVVLRNYLLLANNQHKPSANLRAKYVLQVPESTSLNIRNSFGKVELKGKIKYTNIEADFCTLVLQDLREKINIKTQFGELKGKNLDANGLIISERSDLTFNNLGGKWYIKNTYGKLNINQVMNLQSLKIEAEKADVSLSEIVPSNYNFQVKTRFGRLILPSSFNLSKDKQTAILKTIGKPSININNSFGNISINK